MTRTQAREIALGCLFECMSRGCEPDEVLNTRLVLPGLSDLADEDVLYSAVPDKEDDEYIRDVVTQAYANSIECFTVISYLSKGWKSDRITMMTRTIITLAMAEIRCRSDIPTGVAVNEAVELAKKYDIEKSPQFINGILGTFVRGIPKE